MRRKGGREFDSDGWTNDLSEVLDCVSTAEDTATRVQSFSIGDVVLLTESGDCTQQRRAVDPEFRLYSVAERHVWTLEFATAQLNSQLRKPLGIALNFCWRIPRLLAVFLPFSLPFPPPLARSAIVPGLRAK